jgi:hypothetical protein
MYPTGVDAQASTSAGVMVSRDIYPLGSRPETCSDLRDGLLPRMRGKHSRVAVSRSIEAISLWAFLRSNPAYYRTQ